jgi:hypothetical protein
VAIAPPNLKLEIEEHIGWIAKECEVAMAAAMTEWLAVAALIRFVDCKESQPEHVCPDPDDIPYKTVCLEIGADAVYSRDKHLAVMGAPTVSLNVDRLLRDYARSEAIHIGLKLASGPHS